jgi:hypothetical protein
LDDYLGRILRWLFLAAPRNALASDEIAASLKKRAGVRTAKSAEEELLGMERKRRTNATDEAVKRKSPIP